VLAFFIIYTLPGQPAAVGNVRVVAVVPVNTSRLSVAVAVVLVVNDLYPVDSDPLTSNVEFGLVVPIPICAKE
jgi:hypothetical protein